MSAPQTLRLVQVDLATVAGNLERLRPYAQEAEWRRACACAAPEAGTQFFAARVALRCILAQSAGGEPRDFRFSYGAHGKPALLGAEGEMAAAPAFNISHSRLRAVVALAPPGSAVGVDMEHIAERPAAQRLARRFFAPGEGAALDASADPLAAFYRLWTAKEVVVKAAGGGLTIPLRRFDVSAILRGPEAPVAIEGLGAWRLMAADWERGVPVCVAGAPGEWVLRREVFDWSPWLSR